MISGSELMEQVQAAQLELGTGDPEVALEMVEPLLDSTRAALGDLGFMRRAGDDRARVIEAFCYARVTAILALESQGAASALPRIRAIAAEARDVATPGNHAWKVLCAAAEMLSRCGDAEGAVANVEAAARMAPDEEYVTRLSASIRSMFPGVGGKR